MIENIQENKKEILNQEKNKWKQDMLMLIQKQKEEVESKTQIRGGDEEATRRVLGVQAASRAKELNLKLN